MVRVILHIDMDSFYASIEVRENPRLKGLPVIIGADPKGGRGRGVVAACSYEARGFGVRSAMPISQAYRLSPQAVYLRPNFELYERVSDNVMRIVRRYGGRFEQMSIDEAYLDLSQVVQDFDEAEKIALKIKDELWRRESLTCSIGIASSMAVAKIASDYRKPNGLTVVYPLDVKSFLDPLPVSKIPGVGPKTRKVLETLGLETIGQLARFDVNILVKNLGKHGLYIWRVSNGIDEGEVREYWRIKSVSSEYTFEEDVEDRKLVYERLNMLVEELYDRLMKEGYLFKTATLKIRFEDFETFTKSKSLVEYSQSKEILSEYALELLKMFEDDHRRVRLIGLKVSRLQKPLGEQKTLLTWI